MENKGGFHEHLCPRECLPHPSAVSNKPGYFQVWVCFFIEEQAAECERNVLSKQRQWPQLCLKWDSRPEESFHTSRQKKKKNRKKKCWQQCERVFVCVHDPLPSPSPRRLPGHSVGWLFVLTHALKPSKANSFTRISSVFVVVPKPWMHRSRGWGSVDTDQSPRTVSIRPCANQHQP